MVPPLTPISRGGVAFLAQMMFMTKNILLAWKEILLKSEYNLLPFTPGGDTAEWREGEPEWRCQTDTVFSVNPLLLGL